MIKENDRKEVLEMVVGVRSCLHSKLGNNLILIDWGITTGF